MPSGRSAAGYRLYSAEDLLRLQQIHIGRTLGMTLDQIREMLDDPAFDRRRALVRQRAQIVEQVERAQAMLRAIDVALDSLEPSLRGGTTMHEDEEVSALFDGFDPSQFEEEAQARWGRTDAYAESARRMAAGLDKRLYGGEVVLWDERLTTVLAERTMHEVGGRRRKGDVDRVAAALILQSYLDQASGS